MHAVLQLRGRGLKRPLKNPLILHQQNTYCLNPFFNYQQVLIKSVGYENPSYNHIHREKEN